MESVSNLPTLSRKLHLTQQAARVHQALTQTLVPPISLHPDSKRAVELSLRVRHSAVASGESLSLLTSPILHF